MNFEQEIRTLARRAIAVEDALTRAIHRQTQDGYNVSVTITPKGEEVCR